MVASLRLLLDGKYQRRALLVLGNSAHQLVLMLLGPLVSYLVIRQAGLAQWGAFVTVLISVQLAGHGLSWGNKEYLLRAFAREPATLAAVWQQSLITRALLLLPLWGVLALFLPVTLWGWLFLWLVGLLIYQSHDVLVVYRKTFTFAALVEAVSAAILVAGVLWWGEAITVRRLTALFALAFLVKGVAFGARFRRDTGLLSFSSRGERSQSRSVGINLRYFSFAFPFFLLGFSGLLQSRIDLYVVDYFLSATEVGRYQVFINLLIYLQAAANIILLPFVKAIYRLDYDVIAAIGRRLFALGAVILPPALGFVYLILRFLYEIEFSLPFYLWGFLIVWPLFYYLPIIYALYKANRQNVVIGVNLAGAALNLVLDLWLLPRLGLIGVVASEAVVTCIILVVYWYCGRRMVRD